MGAVRNIGEILESGTFIVHHVSALLKELAEMKAIECNCLVMKWRVRRASRSPSSCGVNNQTGSKINRRVASASVADQAKNRKMTAYPLQSFCA